MVRDGKDQCHNGQIIYLRQAIVDLSKIIRCKSHYNYVKPKYGDSVRLCYMDTDSLVYNIKTDDFCENITGDIEARFDTRGYSHSQVHPLPMGRTRRSLC